MISLEELKTRVMKPGKDQVLFFAFAGMAAVIAFFILKHLHLPPAFRYLAGFLMSLAVLAAGFWKAEGVLYLLVAYIPFAKQMPGDFDGKIPGVNLTNFLVLFSAVLWLAGRFGEGTRKLRKAPLNTPILIFLGWGVLSVIQGLPYGFSYLAQAFSQFFYSWGIGFFLYFLVLNVAKKSEQRQLIVNILIFSTTLAGLMAAYEYMDTGERAGGIFDHANLLASFFCYYLFIPLSFFLFQVKSVQGWVYLASFLILVRGVMVSFSRGGYLAIAVGGMVVTFFRSKILFFLMVGAILVAVIHPDVLPHGVRWRLSQTLEKTPDYAVKQGQAAVHLDRSTSDRFELWKAAGYVIRQNPLWGAGYDRFLPKMQNYWYAAFPFEPHNTFLFIPAEMGMPQLVVFLWILGLLFYQALRIYLSSKEPFYKPLSLGYIGGLFGYIVSNCYAPRLDYPEIAAYFWILAAILFLFDKEKA